MPVAAAKAVIFFCLRKLDAYTEEDTYSAPPSLTTRLVCEKNYY